ncbi:MAG: hypothetical protein K6T78_00170 [Alicyclobacillus sp.]|nr:hypothetical protein [Alicyclobacillus sp.]
MTDSLRMDSVHITCPSDAPALSTWVARELACWLRRCSGGVEVDVTLWAAASDPAANHAPSAPERSVQA